MKMEKKDLIRICFAREADIPGILRLLSQVLEVHASLRPDLFISGTTKYSADELKVILADERRPVYVALDEAGDVVGYAFCILERQPASANLVQFDYMYIDDLCVDETCRGHHVATRIFEYVKAEAIRFGCREITLNVWEGNDTALRFYQKAGFLPRKTMMEYHLT